MWWQRDDQDKQSRPSVAKGWHLVKNHRREDPERHIVEKASTSRVPETYLRDFPPLLHAEVVAFQEEVLGWLELAMVSWLNFYFALGEGAPGANLAEVSEGLDKASERLEAINAQMKYLPGKDSRWSKPVQLYREAITDWGKALELIARGARFDREAIAREGFAIMDDGSRTAEEVVDLRAGPHVGVNLDGRLETLRQMKPRGRVSARAIEKARSPWRRALMAAGSKIDWLPVSN